MKLGPYEIERLLAVGGAAQVWRGRHRQTGSAVAVKCPGGRPRALDPLTLQREVDSLARLEHPGIIRVYDLGHLPAALNGGPEELPAGTPYYVMEMASGGPLSAAPRPEHWGAVAGILLSVLEALAHAHARGVIHRDLKPSNLLRCTGADLRPGLKLSDFGAAHSSTVRQTIELQAPPIAGTPRYMAPEQFDGRWRDQGPPSDLYALGCIAWALVCGTPPFMGRTLEALATAHRAQPPPLMAPRVEVPVGFEVWLRTLLRKHPADRFESAAEAAQALRWLGGPPLDDTTREDLLGTEATHVDPQFVPTAKPVAIGRPPLPLVWPSPPAEAADEALWGPALRSQRARRPRFRGREGECAELLRALHSTASGTQVRLLTGGPGCGRTRLLEHFAAGVAESGGARVLTLSVTAQEPNCDLLIEHSVRGVGLERGLLGLRLTEHGPLWSEAERGELLRMLRPPESKLSPRASAIRLTGPQHRCALFCSWLRDLAGNGPLLLCLDDAHRDPEVLALVAALAGGEAPLLIVLTAPEPIAGYASLSLPHLPALRAHDRLGALWRSVEPGPGLVALELAAASLGEVDWNLWTSACERAQVRVPHELMREIFALGLAEAALEGRGWRFVGQEVPEALRASAAARSRLSSHHAILADLLAAAGLSLSERLARHLIGCGRLEQAIEPLYQAAVQAAERGNAGGALSLLGERAAVLEDLQIAADGLPWAEGSALAARLCLELGDEAQARTHAEVCVARAGVADWETAAGAAAFVLERLGQAHALSRALDACAGIARCKLRGAYARLALEAGALDGAEHALRACYLSGERHGDPVERARARVGLARLMLAKGDRAEARSFLDEAAPLLDRSEASHALDEWYRVDAELAL